MSLIQIHKNLEKQIKILFNINVSNLPKIEYLTLIKALIKDKNNNKGNLIIILSYSNLKVIV